MNRLLTIGPNRSFCLLLAAVCTVLSLLSHRSGHGHSLVWGALAVLFLLIALILPRILAPVRLAWLSLGYRLSWVVNPLILGMVYTVVVVPVGVLMRLCGRDPMMRRRDPTAASYWVKRSGKVGADSLKEQ